MSDASAVPSTAAALEYSQDPLHVPATKLPQLLVKAARMNFQRDDTRQHGQDLDLGI